MDTPAPAPAAETTPVAPVTPVIAAVLAADPNAPIIINGETVTPATHVFRDGKPVITKDGKPRRRPGPTKGFKHANGSPAAAPQAPKAPAVTESAPAAQAPAPEAGAAPPAVSRAGKATVTRVTGKFGVTESKEENLEVRTFVTQPAMVDMGYGLTLNIGNYESARVDVRISIPCYVEEADAAFAYAKKWVADRIQTEVSEVRKITTTSKSAATPF